MVHKGRCEGFAGRVKGGMPEASDSDFISFLMMVIGNLIWRRRWRLGRREIVEGDEAAFERMRKVKVMP